MFKSITAKSALFLGAILFSTPLFGPFFNNEDWCKFQQNIKNASCKRPKQIVDKKGVFKIWFDIEKNKVTTHPLFMPTEELIRTLNNQNKSKEETTKNIAIELLENFSGADLDWAQEIPSTASHIMVIANPYMKILGKLNSLAKQGDFSIIYQDNSNNIQYPVIPAQQFITNRSLLLNDQTIVDHIVNAIISDTKIGFVPPISAWLLHQPLFKDTFTKELIKEINKLKPYTGDEDCINLEQSLVLTKSLKTFAYQLEKIVHIGSQQQDLDLLNMIMAVIKNKINMYIIAIKSDSYTPVSIDNAKVMYKLLKIVGYNSITDCKPCDCTDCCWHED